jgi:CRP-like cAMP-binding protein
MKRLSVTPSDAVQFSRSVRKLRLFESMNMGLLEKILEGLLFFEYGRGEAVCLQGEAGDSFYVVQQGRLSVSLRKGKLSKPKPVATLEAGDCFGEMALLRQAPRNATVACLDPSRIFVLPARHFQTVLGQNPGFAAEIQELAATRQFELDHRYG